MILFCSNFASGFARDLAPAMQSNLWFTMGFAGLVGLCSGSCTGPTARVLHSRTR